MKLARLAFSTRFALTMFLTVVLLLSACSSTESAPQPDLGVAAATYRIQPDSTRRDSSAEGGRAAILYRTGDRARFDLSRVPYSRNGYRVTVRARADYYQGWPVMQPIINGFYRSEKDNDVRRSSYGRGGDDLGRFCVGSATISGSSDVLELRFGNDAYGGSPDKDRNLYIDYITLEEIPASVVRERDDYLLCFSG